MIVGSLEIQIMSDTAKLARDMNDAQRTVDSTMGKIGKAIGVGFAYGWEKAKEAWEAFKSWMETTLIIWGIALATGIATAVLGAVYAAFRAISFGIGLLTGESYKSANIDALVAMNKEVKTLQENLPLTAVGASALNEALKQQGTNADGYAKTLGSVNTAQHANGEELDRLGVKYKDQNGNLLDTNTTLASAAAVLATYTSGWDRHQAEIAIAMGNEKQIQDALVITSDKAQTAKDRLIDYGLIIGEGTQEAVAEYDEAMRAFNRELDLTSQGFKRAISDNVMPLLTQFAQFFREGFPTAVMAFRYSMATIVSLFYGLKTVVFLVAESIVGSLSAIGSVMKGLALAAGLALTGDFSGAKDALIQGWIEAKARLGGIGDNIVEQARRNAAAMKLAWAADSLGANGQPNATTPGGKPWVPKPEISKETKELADNEAAYRSLLKTLKEKLLVGRELTEVNKLQIALDALSEKQRAAITPEREKELKALAALVDLNKQRKEQMENEAKNEAALTKMRQEGIEAQAAYDLKRGENLILAYKNNEQMEFETALIGKTNTERETAIALRALENSEIDKQSESYTRLREKMKDAIAAKNIAEEGERQQVDMWQSIDRVAHDTFVNIYNSGKSAFDRLRDTLRNGIYDLLYQMTVKKWIIQIAAQISGGGVAQKALGSGGGLFGSIISSLAGLFGGGLTTNTGQGGADFLTSAIPGLVKMAGGGDFMVNRPTLFLAGEAGPERARFSGANRTGGGDTVNNFTVDMRGASVEAVARLERLVLQVNGSIESRAVAATSDWSRRR